MTADASTQWPADDPHLAAVLDIIAKETGVERSRLTPDASLAELEIASLELVQTIFALESHFNVEIPVIADHDGAEFATVGLLVAQVLTEIRRNAA